MCPTLIQDARQDPRFRRDPGVRAGLTRYLGVPVHWADGAPAGTLCFLDDRSEELLGEADAEFLTFLAMRASAELERERLLAARIAEERAAAECYAAVARQVLRTAEEKRRFYATIIHDLRQPVSAMRALLYLLGEESDPAEHAECLQLLEERVSAVGMMIDELLEYAQIQAGEIVWRPEALTLPTFLTACVEAFRPEAQVLDVRLDLSVDPALHGAHLDRAKLTHAVRNLISNAIKYAARAEGPAASEGGCVRVDAHLDPPDHWHLRVEDDGPGMPPEVIDHIFDEFYQAPTTPSHEQQTGQVRGRGLGLSIVKHLCAAMGAGISVHSVPGEGTSFTLRLPLRHPE